MKQDNFGAAPINRGEWVGWGGGQVKDGVVIEIHG